MLTRRSTSLIRFATTATIPKTRRVLIAPRKPGPQQETFLRRAFHIDSADANELFFRRVYAKSGWSNSRYLRRAIGGLVLWAVFLTGKAWFDLTWWLVFECPEAAEKIDRERYHLLNLDDFDALVDYVETLEKAFDILEFGRVMRTMILKYGRQEDLHETLRTMVQTGHESLHPDSKSGRDLSMCMPAIVWNSQRQLLKKPVEGPGAPLSPWWLATPQERFAWEILWVD